MIIHISIEKRKEDTGDGFHILSSFRKMLRIGIKIQQMINRKLFFKSFLHMEEFLIEEILKSRKICKYFRKKFLRKTVPQEAVDRLQAFTRKLRRKGRKKVSFIQIS